MKILVCEPEKPPYVKEISEDVSDMQAVVGGYIEAVYFEEKGDALIFCNDEFLLNGSQPNRIVGELLIHGTFFVVGDTTNSIGEHVSCSLTDEQIEKYTEQFTPMVQQLTPQEVMAILFGMEEESQDFGMM